MALAWARDSTASSVRAAATFRETIQALERGEAEVTAMTELGSLDGRLWQYLGRRAVAPGDVLRWEGLRFRVRSSRPWYLGSALAYWWASLERAKEAVE